MAEYFEYAYLDRFHTEVDGERLEFDRLKTERDDKLFPRPGDDLKSLNYWGGQGWQVVSVTQSPTTPPPDASSLEAIISRLHPTSSGISPSHTRYLLGRRWRK